MDQITIDLRRLCGSHGHEGYTAATLLETILKNILENPGEPKFRNLSTRSKKLQDALAYDEFFATLIALGFIKRIESFEEKWSLPHLSTIAQAKIRDVHVLLQDFMDRYKVNKEAPKPLVTPYSVIKQQEEQKKEYWKKMTRDAEADRLEKLEREERALRLLNAQQTRRQHKLTRKQESFRRQFDLLSKPPPQGPRPAPRYPLGQEPPDEGLGSGSLSSSDDD